MERKTKKNQHCFQLRNAGVPDKKKPVLSTSGGCHPKGFIVAYFCNFEHVGNNHYNKVGIIKHKSPSA